MIMTGFFAPSTQERIYSSLIELPNVFVRWLSLQGFNVKIFDIQMHFDVNGRGKVGGARCWFGVRR
jgi:hypothetical protein